MLDNYSHNSAQLTEEHAYTCVILRNRECRTWQRKLVNMTLNPGMDIIAAPGSPSKREFNFPREVSFTDLLHYRGYDTRRSASVSLEPDRRSQPSDTWDERLKAGLGNHG